MPINRYTSLTPSTYDPLSMQEIMVTPMAMRKQHDDLLAKQEAIRSGLAKVDPDDKYFNEAVQLKKGIEDKINQSAQKLSQEGFSNNMMGETIALNREYNDLVAPTGKIGMINQHKANLAKTYQEYVNDAVKMGNSQEVAESWAKEALQKHRDVNQTPMYDDKGRVIDFKIDQSPVKYIDTRSVINDLATKAGFNEGNRGWALENIVTDPNTGMTYVKGDQGKSGHGDNYKQLNALSEYINAEVLDPNSDVRKSLDYNRQDLNSVLNKAGKQIDIYKSSKDSSESGNSISNLHMPPAGDGSGDKSEATPTGIFDPESQTTVGKESGEYDFSKIGKIYDDVAGLKITKGGDQSRHTYVKGNGKHTYKDIITNPLEQKLYENSYNKLVKAGKINKNRSMNDPVAAASVQTYMNKHMPKVRLGSSIIQPDIDPSAEMFAGQTLGKDANQRNATMQSHLDADLREIINPETNLPFKKGEFAKNGYKVEYIGYDSPINFRGYKFGDKLNENVMAHKVLLKDSEGKVIGKTTVSRTKEEKEMPQFKASYIINNGYKNAVLNIGEWTSLGTFHGVKNDAGAQKFNGYKVKYNADGTMQVRDKQGNVSAAVAPDQFKDFVYTKYFEQ